MRRYNWRPDRPDNRDLIYTPVSMLDVMPPLVDLRPKCPPVFDQGQIGSCTGNALAGALWFLSVLRLAPSRLFIYYNERVMEGNVGQDAGASIRDGVKSLNQIGACSEKDWPYQRARLFKKPSAASYRDAAARRITKYQRVADLAGMRISLARGFPVVFGFTVFESFESDDVAKTGIMPMPLKSERSLGGHAVMAVGYDDANKRLIVRNSWGSAWGAAGYFYMPYDYLPLCDDFWRIEK